MKSSIYYIILVWMLASWGNSVAQGPSLKLWYRQPAEKWTESLPIGNGRLGAMIFGGLTEDHLQFNESTLWSGGPRDYQRAGAAQYLEPIRQLIAAGQQDKAEALAEQHFMGRKDKDEEQYALLKSAWTKKVRGDTSFAERGLDDRTWKDMSLPTPNGWETAGLEGVDGAVWFRTTFDLPPSWTGKDLVLDLGRIRDVDFSYLNGKRIGSGEGISNKRHYHIPAALCKPGKNVIAIQVLNYDDKGGFTGVKGDHKTLIIYPEGTNPDQGLGLAPAWKYKVQDEEPPTLPKYEADYQPFGDLYLRYPGQEQVRAYRRELDLRQAIATTTYDCNGVHYTREYFASEPQQVMVLHIGADKPGKISLQALFHTPHRSFSIRRIDAHTLALFVKVRNGVLKGVAYLQVQTLHGETEVSDEGINIRYADEVVFYLTAATNFVNYKDVSGDPEAVCRNVLRSLKGMTWSAVREAHIREYRSHFDAFSIELGVDSPGAADSNSGGPAGVNTRSGSSGPALPTDQRIRQFSPEKDPALIALYVQYGRYLLISSSRPNSPMPANLQGLWNDLLTPPWGSKYTTNINLEMNYWLAEPLNLSDCSQPLFRLIRNLSKAGSLTAAAHYNAPGWVLHHNTDLWCGTAPINASNHGIWVTGGAWLCHQLWEHYQFTQDKNFLREYYPILKEAAEFFAAFLVEDPRRGWLISTPSNSPEHGGLVAGPSMDHQLIRDLFKNCIAASRLLHTDSAFRQLLEEKNSHIAPSQVGRYGQLQEWLEDKDDTADHHRHVSHLWGVYPGTDITWKDNPALMKAARQSLLYRGDDGTGWSLAWKANLWARMREGDHAMLMVEKLLSSAAETQGGEKGGVYPNLFDAHPPFQIDGNFGGAAGIAEMLLQSQEGTLDLLPALPAVLPDGEVKGICSRGGFTLNIKWRQGALQQVELMSRRGGSIVLRYKEKRVSLYTYPGQHYKLSGELKAIR
ncbi:MAG TPA: glycoside hydrolase N-terminal domain-containing protein [Puia sp.]|nr:glycoside hydrolase N-terminal domain-containing protein [Puia sp.]